MLSSKHDAVLIKLIELFQGENITWALTGSTSFTIQGMDMEPHDIDIQTDEKSAYKIGELLTEYVIRPVKFSSTDTIRSHFGVFEIDRLRIEVMGGIQKKHNDMWEEIIDLKPLIDYVNYKKMSLPVINLSYESMAYRKLGRNERADIIEGFINSNLH